MARRNRNRGGNFGYDDDDEIDRSIKEFQHGQQLSAEAEAVASQPEAPENADEQLPPDDEEEKDSDPPEDKTIEEKATALQFACSCCGAQWTFKGNRASKPGCSCPIRKSCKKCGHCTAHCVCRKQQEQQAEQA